MKRSDVRKLDLSDFEIGYLEDFKSGKRTHELLHAMIKGVLKVPVILLTDRPFTAWETVLLKSKLVLAAGGMIKNNEGKYLFIHRRGWWDLPKGKLDKGESFKQAAIREVKEEVGIDAKIVSKLPDTYHVYMENNKLILKHTAWFKMKSEQMKIILQTEEDIVDGKWISPKRFNSIRGRAYPNLHSLMDEVE